MSTIWIINSDLPHTHHCGMFKGTVLPGKKFTTFCTVLTLRKTRAEEQCKVLFLYQIVNYTLLGFHFDPEERRFTLIMTQFYRHSPSNVNDSAYHLRSGHTVAWDNAVFPLGRIPKINGLMALCMESCFWSELFCLSHW